MGAVKPNVSRGLSRTLSRLLNPNLRWGRRPIIIGGCARSGTTLLLSILSSDPRIFGIPVETQAFCPTAYYGTWDPDAPLNLEVIRHHLLSTKLPRCCQYWCEKTPKNVHFFGRLLTHFGKSLKLIHLVRDGRDVVCSTHPDAPDRFWVEPQRWVADVQAGVAYFDHPQVFTFRFEDLVSNFAETLEGLCEFLELSASQRMKAFPHYATLQSSNAWYESAYRPTMQSIGKWQKETLSQRVEELMAIPDAQELLRRFHYL